MSSELKEEAARLFHKALEQQMKGNLGIAEELYKRSISIFPTAEAHTFLGWTFSFDGRFEDAIGECRKAIEVDPEFGNPWNDIGAYLIELGREDEAIRYLESAKNAKRHENRCFPHFNLSRIHFKRSDIRKGMEELLKAIEVEPEFEAAWSLLKTIQQRN